MNFPQKRPIIVGLVASGSAGAAALITLALANSQTSHPQFAAAPARSIDTSAPASPALRRAVPTPSASAPSAISVPKPVTLDQARVIAERAGGGRTEHLEADAGPTGMAYGVSVIRADGSEVQVVVDARTGRVLSNVAEPADNSEPQDAQGPQDVPEPQDIPQPAETQSDQTD